ncbi:MAG: YgjV family protein, partial [Rhodobacteraceae bacterium]|nr:YgjV family protein [Paracoccaceae bacterium]
MMHILSHFADAPGAIAFGTAGLAGQLVWPLLRSRSRILTAQLGIAGCYALQYACLGQWSGTGVCLIGACQTLTALAATGRPRLRGVGLAFLPLVLLSGCLTWSGAATAFATAACCLMMIGRLQQDTLRMRAVMLCAAPFGIGFDLTVGAAPGLAGAILSAAMSAAALRREWRARCAAPPRAAVRRPRPLLRRPA